jgi:hypothetical protein
MTDTPKHPSAGDKPEDIQNTTDNGDTSSSDTTKVPEIGGRGGLDPARYGDWEIGGRCVDF